MAGTGINPMTNTSKRKHSSEIIISELDRIDCVSGLLRAALTQELGSARLIPRHKLSEVVALMSEIVDDMREEIQRDPDEITAARKEFREMLRQVRETNRKRI